MRLSFLPLLLAGLTFGASALAGDNDQKAVAPPSEESWQIKLSLPALVPWLTGETAVNGFGTSLDLAPRDILKRIDMVADVRAEAHKGRLSLMGEFFYMSLSDGVGTKTVVKKLDLQVDQTMADLGVGWRLIETPRGWLEVIGGLRYNNYHQNIGLQPNDPRIDGVATKLAAAGTGKRVASQLRTLKGEDPTLPIAPLEARAIGKITRAIKRLGGAAAERQAQIADLLHDELSRTISRVDDWWDPYIGVRGRYDLNRRCYLSAKADIGGFTVGADISWTAEASLGFQVAPNLFTEIGYRAIGVDYDKDGLTMRTVTHGPQWTFGINF